MAVTAGPLLACYGLLYHTAAVATGAQVELRNFENFKELEAGINRGWAVVGYVWGIIRAIYKFIQGTAVCRMDRLLTRCGCEVQNYRAGIICFHQAVGATQDMLTRDFGTIRGD